MSATLDVVVGAQYGSEGKGHVTAQLVRRHLDQGRTVLNVRVAGPNAGHTVFDAHSRKYPLRTVPVGATVSPISPARPVSLYIAPGSEVDLDVLVAEVTELREDGHPLTMLHVSGEATVLVQAHKDTESARDMHSKIGSTAKGVGAARSERIMRSAQRVKDSDEALQRLAVLGVGVVDDDVEFMSSWVSDPSASIVVEGTQGYGLGLHAGHYPQCTSSDTRAVDFLAMAGISPWSFAGSVSVWACARVYPIRVAGNSGPLVGETSWEALGLPAEYTTVTRKVRRVGLWDPSLVRRAVTANGGSPVVRLALTMVDQKLPELAGVSGDLASTLEAHPGLRLLVESVEKDAAADVELVSTSPSTALWA